MARLLVTVEKTWVDPAWMRRFHRLPGRPHLCLAPGVVVGPSECFRPGDQLLLKRPDGSAVEARIGGFVCQCYPIRDDNLIAVPDLLPGDVPVGTEVWSVDETAVRRP